MTATCDIEKLQAELAELRAQNEELREACAELTASVNDYRALERSLRKSEKRLAKAQYIGRMGDWEWHVRSGELLWSPEMYSIFGVPPDFVPSLAAFESFIHPEDVESVRWAIEQAVSRGLAPKFDFRIVTPAGATRFLSSVGEVINGEDGNPSVIVGINQDLTERKRTEAAFRESRKLYKLLADTSTDLIAMTDVDGRPTFMNARWHDYAGISVEEVNVKGWQTLVHPDDLPALVAARKAAAAAGGAHETEIRYRRHDGRYRWFWRRVVAVREDSGEVTGWVCVCTDITDRRESQEALRQSEERFRIAMTGSAIVAFSQDCDLRYTWVYNPSQGVKVEDVLGKTDHEIFREDDADHYVAIKREVMATGVPRRDEVVTHRDAAAGGDLVHVLVTEPMVDSGGSTVGVFCAAVDITGRKQAQEAMRVSEERFRKIFEEGPIGALILDLEYRFVKTNRRFCEMCGYSQEELLAIAPADLTHPDDVPVTMCYPKQLVEGKIGHFSVEKRYLHRNGTIIWTTVTAWLMKDAAGRPSYIIATVEDITDKKKLQKQLILAAKRDERAKSSRKILNYEERLGQLASKLSIAQEEERRRIAVQVHDGIGQNLAFCKLKVGQLQGMAKELAPALEEVMETIERCIAASRSLSFELSPAVLFDIGLEPALQWLARLHTARHGIRVTVTGQNVTPLPLPFRILLFQAAREFVANAVKHAEASHIEISLSESRRTVLIAVSDDGAGFVVPEAGALPHFTSGFGLLNVQEQLRNAGGTLQLKSVPGRGTRAEAALPLKRRRK